MMNAQRPTALHHTGPFKQLFREEHISYTALPSMLSARRSLQLGAELNVVL